MHHSSETRQFLRALPLIVIGGIFLSGFAISMDSHQIYADISTHDEFRLEKFNEVFFEGSNNCSCREAIQYCPEETEIDFYSFDSGIRTQTVITRAKKEIPFRKKQSKKKIYSPSLAWNILNGRMNQKVFYGRGCMMGSSIFNL